MYVIKFIIMAQMRWFGGGNTTHLGTKGVVCWSTVIHVRDLTVLKVRGRCQRGRNKGRDLEAGICSNACVSCSCQGL